MTVPCWLQSLVFWSVLGPGAFIIAELNQELCQMRVMPMGANTCSFRGLYVLAFKEQFPGTVTHKLISINKVFLSDHSI